MQQVYEHIARVALSNTTVLIRGLPCRRDLGFCDILCVEDKLCLVAIQQLLSGSLEQHNGGELV